MGKKKKRKVLKDSRGQYRIEIFFVNGKQKKTKVRLIEGIPAAEFIAKNADPLFLIQEGYYHLLHDRGM